MSGMDIKDFLLARIAEDEAAARDAMQDEADDGVWTTGDNNGEHEGYPGDCTVEGVGIKIYDEGGHDLDQARHIAGWDPRRVLAECAAKRAIIEGWEPWFGDDGMTAEQYDLGEQTAIHHAAQALEIGRAHV